MDIKNTFTPDILLRLEKIRSFELDAIIRKCEILIDHFGDHQALMNIFRSDYVSFGVCAVVDIVNKDIVFLNAIAETFKNVYRDQNGNINLLFPVGGFSEYKEKDTQIFWENPRRLEYAIHVRNFCETLLKLKNPSSIDSLKIRISNL